MKYYWEILVRNIIKKDKTKYYLERQDDEIKSKSCRKSVRISAATECGYRVSIYFLSWYRSKEYQQRLQQWFNWFSNNNRNFVSQFWKLCHDCHSWGI